MSNLKTHMVAAGIHKFKFVRAVKIVQTSLGQYCDILIEPANPNELKELRHFIYDKFQITTFFDGPVKQTAYESESDGEFVVWLK